MDSDHVIAEIVKSAGEGSVSSEEIGKILVTESDRGCAIFGGCILDDELELLLRSFFRSENAGVVREHIDPLFKGEAPLSTFSSRIKIAFALGLITRNVHRRLDIIRKLRNDFAHTTGALDFNDPKCRDRWDNLAEEWKPVLPKDASGKIDPKAKKIGFIFAVQSVAKDIRVIRNVIERLDEVKQLKSMVLRMENVGM